MFIFIVVDPFIIPQMTLICGLFYFQLIRLAIERWFPINSNMLLYKMIEVGAWSVMKDNIVVGFATYLYGELFI